MPKHIGIVACSAEGAALCYRTIAAESAARMGEHMHPEVSMHTFPLGDYMVPIRAGDWERVAQMMVASVRKLAGCGAELAICPDNTIHEAFDLVVKESPIPWLHIADAVGNHARQQGHTRLAITGTKYLTVGPVYPSRLGTMGIASEIPDERDRETIDTIIFDELVYGVIRDESRAVYNGIVEKMKSRGCDAVVLGCTEIPLLADPDTCPLPCLDSTRLLARAAIAQALGA